MSDLTKALASALAGGPAVARGAAAKSSGTSKRVTGGSSTSTTSTTTNQQTSQSQSTTKKVLDEALLGRILGGLQGGMSQDEIAAYAQSLLAPQLNAGLEAAEQGYQTTKLSKEQEIANLAAQLAGAIGAQNAAYNQSVARTEASALARGMGRSSYTMQSIANQGSQLAQAVRQLTDENTRQTQQLQAQITQAARQAQQTKNRLNTDYAAQLAAKQQELAQQQRQDENSNYMGAISFALGQQTNSQSQSQGESHTQSQKTTTNWKAGRSGSGAKQPQAHSDVDAISGAAPSVRRMTQKERGQAR